jgi:tRNA(Ile)-lysidine synthase
VNSREAEQLQRTVAAVLSEPPRVVLAVSGGIDSTVLLDAAAETVGRDRLTVATFDHGTGDAARTAVDLVRAWCAELGVECVTGRAGVVARNEAGLRSARWKFLGEVARDRSAVVATAHTEDDQIETVLMRVMRASGARGLAGLYANTGVLRPLVSVRRREIAGYASARGLRWIEDPTNASAVYFRNRVRHDLLPAMRRVDDSIDERLLAIARRSAEWRAEVEALCDRIHSPESEVLLGGTGVFPLRFAQRRDDVGVRVSLEALPSEAAARLLWPVLAARAGVVLDRRGLDRLAVFSVGGRVGGRVQLSGGWEVTRGRQALVLAPVASKRATPEPFALSDGTRLGGWSFRATPGAAFTSFDDFWSAWLPADAPLAVRSWRAGDAVEVGNDGHRRKVKHLLTKAGVTGHERAGWPVVLAGDEIVWIPGVRRTDAATARSGRPGLAFVCEYHNR